MSLETGAVFDGALSSYELRATSYEQAKSYSDRLSGYFRRGWGCMSVMSVLEKCDEKVGRNGGVYADWIVRTIRPTKIFLWRAGFWLCGGLEGWGAEWAF